MPTAADQQACGMPGNLANLPLVRETWTTDPLPTFDGQPLADGVYVQTARTLYCADDYDPPPVLEMTSASVEIEGCVLRLVGYIPGSGSTVVGVETFTYVGPGKLDVTIECPVQMSLQDAPFAFDGTTIQIPNSSEAVGPEGQAYDCTYVDTFVK